MPEPEIKPSSVKQRLDDINSISIAIDTYDDIFSDFDPRDDLERDLSGRISLDSPGVIYYTHRCKKGQYA